MGDVRPRPIAIVSLTLFVVSVLCLVLAPKATWPEYPGIFFHLSILVLTSRMTAPAWATASAYLWVGLDVLTAILILNAAPHNVAWPARMAGHIFAGVWILTTSLCTQVTAIRVVGVVTGVWLAGYSLVAHVIPDTYLRPTGLLVPIWLFLVATMLKTGPASPDRLSHASR
ncbi:hypothetical protein [Actinoplanes sp. NPDC049265]|uniref:hypothetical protein n=1 Tax=Actinoplanes sp. NPDC049265 TaxID=3363902 RepID=UPI0037160DCC